MPELPDVEGYRRELAKRLPGRRVRDVTVTDAGVLRNSSATAFVDHLRGHRFTTPGRHGKWLLLPTDGPTLVVHSGMTGRPRWERADDPPDRFDRVRIRLDRGELRYADMRKLRGLWLVDGPDELARVIGRSGPDALTASRDEFARALSSGRRVLKTALTDQAVLAGLGNLLSDEICWQARVHPLRTCGSLDGTEVSALYSTMRRVLRTSVRHQCVPSLRNWLTRVRDDKHAVCPRCDAPLERARNQGRMTVWCPREQAR